MSSGLWTEVRQGSRGMYAGPHGFAGKHILSVTQWNREQLDAVLKLAREMQILATKFGTVDILRGYILGNLFYAPSTRTSSSFATAMYRLGGHVIQINGVQYSSVTKGESFSDTIRTLEAYCSVLVVRHPEVAMLNNAVVAPAGFNTPRPVINGGDGTGEHPTQALLDLFTIHQESGGVDGRHVVIMGDLKDGRTIHGLARLLSEFENVSLSLVSPRSLMMPPEAVAFLRENHCTVVETEHLAHVMGTADVLYVTGIPQEGFGDCDDVTMIKSQYRVDQKVMASAPEKLVLMHPFPRGQELAISVDSDPRAAYFRQMEYGVYMRMALLALVLGQAR